MKIGNSFGESFLCNRVKKIEMVPTELINEIAQVLSPLRLA
jgi:hypothetical protein